MIDIITRSDKSKNTKMYSSARDLKDWVPKIVQKKKITMVTTRHLQTLFSTCRCMISAVSYPFQYEAIF